MERPDHHPPIAPWEILAVTLCTLTGAFLRFYNLPHLPPGLWYDEAINGLDALQIIREPGWPVFFSTENHMREPMWMYLQAVGVLVGGTNATALRAVSAVVGTLTIPAVWWMTRTLAGPRAALFALLFMTPMRWHVQFSRLSFRTILSPLFASLIVTFAIRTTRRQRLADALATGALLGAALYTYLSMRLFVLGFGVWAGWYWIASWREWPARLLARNAAAAAGAFTLVFATAAVDYLRHPDHFTGRQEEVSLVSQGAQGWGIIARQARDVALMPILRGDHVAKHNIPGPPRFAQAVLWGSNGPDSAAWWQDIDPTLAPDKHGTGLAVFDLFTGLLFYLGLALIIWRVMRSRSWEDRLILMWLIIGASASIFSYGAPNMLRMQLLTAACAYTLAIAAEAIWNKLADRSRAAAILVLGGWLAWFASGEVYRYFVVYPRHPAVYFEFNSNFAEIARWMRDQTDRPADIIIPGHIANAPTFAFEADSIRGIRSDETAGEIPPNAWVLLPRQPFPLLRLDVAGDQVELVNEFKFPSGETWAVLVRKKE